MSASNGRLIAEMTVTDQSVNMSDQLHGGMTATLIDQLSSMALTTALVDSNDPKIDPKYVKVKSVSVDLSISFMNGIKRGQTLVIDANTLKAGKTLAFLDVHN